MKKSQLRQIIKEEIKSIKTEDLHVLGPQTNTGKVPEGWNESSLDDEDRNDYARGAELLKMWTAPMEGWDQEHLDMVFLVKYEPENEYPNQPTFWVDFYIAYGDSPSIGPLNSEKEAEKEAIQAMYDIKADWTDDAAYV